MYSGQILRFLGIVSLPLTLEYLYHYSRVFHSNFEQGQPLRQLNAGIFFIRSAILACSFACLAMLSMKAMLVLYCIKAAGNVWLVKRIEKQILPRYGDCPGLHEMYVREIDQIKDILFTYIPLGAGLIVLLIFVAHIN